MFFEAVISRPSDFLPLIVPSFRTSEIASAGIVAKLPNIDFGIAGAVNHEEIYFACFVVSCFPVVAAMPLHIENDTAIF